MRRSTGPQAMGDGQRPEKTRSLHRDFSERSPVRVTCAPSFQRQRGVALITAVLIVALATSCIRLGSTATWHDAARRPSPRSGIPVALGSGAGLRTSLRWLRSRRQSRNR